MLFRFRLNELNQVVTNPELSESDVGSEGVERTNSIHSHAGSIGNNTGHTSSDTSDSNFGSSSSADFARIIMHDAVDELVSLLEELARSRATNPSKHRLCALLHRAVNVGSVKVARELLSRGVFVDCRSGRQDTPLHRAALRGDRKMTELLLEFGADVEVHRLSSAILQYCNVPAYGYGFMGAASAPRCILLTSTWRTLFANVV